MESTGVYWKPIYAILEGAFQIWWPTHNHFKKVRGGKTDGRCGMDCGFALPRLCVQFRAPQPIRELRGIDALSSQLVESRSAERKPPAEAAGDRQHQVASVATDVFGVSAV